MVKRRLWVLIAILVALGLVLFLTREPQPPTPTPSGSFAFAALGDAPYYPWEELRFRLVIKDIRQHDLRFILHVGDIFWHPCSDAMYLKTRARFAEMAHPVLYTPGDNEWTDCWEQQSGSFSPRERLDRIRQLFFRDGSASQPRFIENRRWEQDGIVFATIHLVGSRNAMRPFPRRTAEDDAEVRRRTEAAATWLRETFAHAKSVAARGVVIACHADPGLGEARYRQLYEPFTTALEQVIEQFAPPVLLIHGDGHIYLIDHPLRDGRGFTRMQVPGSPDVGWVRVVVTPNSPSVFAFEEHVVPRWKFW